MVGARSLVPAAIPDPALARLKTTPPPLDLGAAASPRRPPSEETSDGSSLAEEGDRGASSPGRPPNWCSAATRSARRSRAALVVTIAVLGGALGDLQGSVG
ncbi:MAG: hypothetical protein V2A73_05620, partial [Pseudomonadota bacterium]